MRKSVLFLFIAMLTAMLSGCIISKSPSTPGVTMIPGEQKTFSIKVFPSQATFTWTLDSTPPVNTSNSYIYTAQSGVHYLTVTAGKDKWTWNIHVESECIWSYDFEAGEDDWSESNGIWQVGTPAPTSGPGGAHSGTMCAATNLDGTYPPADDSTLISPSINLPSLTSGQELHLRFWHWFSFASTGPYYHDYGYVKIQTEISPGVWSDWSNLTYFIGDCGGVWTHPLIDLSAYAGKKVHLGFELNAGTGGTAAGWFIDDVTLEII